jgi:hypothetical protein
MHSVCDEEEVTVPICVENKGLNFSGYAEADVESDNSTDALISAKRRKVAEWLKETGI